MVRAPLHFHGRIPVPEVAPLTYRDGVSQLELVYELSQYLKNILHPSLQSTVNKVVADAERLLSDATAQYVDGVEEFQRIHDAFMSDVRGELIALNDTSVTDLIDDDGSLLSQRLSNMLLDGLGKVNVSWYGAVPGASNMAQRMNRAADSARELGLPLYIPEGVYRVDGTLNFRYLNIECDAHLIIDHDNIGVIVGDNSQHRNSRTIKFTKTHHHTHTFLGHEYPAPTIRVVGLKGAKLQLGTASFVQFYADANIRESDSVAYNHTESHRINRFEIFGENGLAWINQNVFFGGDWTAIIIRGSYGHNNNKWFMPSIESGDSFIDFQTGSVNIIEDGRSETYTPVRFGPNVWKCVISSLYVSNQSLHYYGFKVEEDLGFDNVVTTNTANNHIEHTLFSINRDTVVTENAIRIPGYKPPTNTVITPMQPTVDGGKLTSRNSNHWVFDTGKIPIEHNFSGIGESQAGSTRITKFHMYSDASVIRPFIIVYDQHGKMLPASAGNNEVREYSGLSASTGNSWGHSDATNFSAINIMSSDVKYIRIYGRIQSTGTPFQSVNLIAYQPKGSSGTVISMMKKSIQLPTHGSRLPTQGSPAIGTVLTVGTKQYINTAQQTMYLAADHGQTDRLNVDDASGIRSDDIIGVMVEDMTTHWTTVVGVNGNDITLEDPTPSRSVEGATVQTARWEQLV